MEGGRKRAEDFARNAAGFETGDAGERRGRIMAVTNIAWCDYTF